MLQLSENVQYISFSIHIFLFVGHCFSFNNAAMVLPGFMLVADCDFDRLWFKPLLVGRSRRSKDGGGVALCDATRANELHQQTKVHPAGGERQLLLATRCHSGLSRPCPDLTFAYS